eukprot:4994212-Ditylum_brightwellii.AAC.1
MATKEPGTFNQSAWKRQEKVQMGKNSPRNFQTKKKIANKDALQAYPYLNSPFKIHTDASDWQLGAVIAKKGNPLAFYSRKLNAAQRNYTTTE